LLIFKLHFTNRHFFISGSWAPKISSRTPDIRQEHWHITSLLFSWSLKTGPSAWHRHQYLSWCDHGWEYPREYWWTCEGQCTCCLRTIERRGEYRALNLNRVSTRNEFEGLKKILSGNNPPDEF
jgi:hypothetical protein